MGKEILVVARDKLFEDNFFSGFIPVENTNYLDIVLNNLEYRERNDDLEHDVNYKQIIPYIFIINPETKKVFVYRRAQDERYKEERLRNKWSAGIGGHVDKDTEEGTENPVIAGMMRELHEEVRMKTYPMPKIVGFVTQDNKMIEHYHLGVVAILETTEDVERSDEEIAEGVFMSVKEADKLFADTNNEVEMFTQLSWSFIKQYLQSL